MSRRLSLGESFYHPKSDLLHLFFGATVRRIAISLISIFSAVYVFEISSEYFGSTKLALLTVSVYYLLLFLSKFVAYAIAEDLSQKVGFKHVIWWSLAPFTVFIILLALSASYPFLLFIAPIFWGLHAGFYWWGFHGYFIKSGDFEHYGEGMGEEQLLEATVGIFVPIAGAVIVDVFGFNALFIVAYLFLLMAVILLGFKQDKKQKHDEKVIDVFQKMMKYKRNSIAFIGASIDLTIFTAFWPLFLFLYFGQVISLGIIISAGSFAAALFTVIIGRWFDKGKKTTPIRVGSPLLSIAWLFRFFSGTTPVFVLADTLTLFSSKLVNLPLDAIAYRKGSEQHAARAILFREYSLLLGSVIAFLVMIGLVLLGSSIRIIFIFAALGSLLPVIAFMGGSEDE